MAAAMPWLLSGLGLIILLLAGDSLVKGAVNLSLRLGVPALIVSLTIVAFGTSAPELLIAIQAVINLFNDWNLERTVHTAADDIDEEELEAIKRSVGSD